MGRERVFASAPALHMHPTQRHLEQLGNIFRCENFRCFLRRRTSHVEILMFGFGLVLPFGCPIDYGPE
jgi:hypothetical protein